MEQRKITEIITELMAHPEYVHHELWTKEEVRNWVAEDFKIDEPDTLKEILTGEDYNEFEDFFWHIYELALDDALFEYRIELETRIQRHIKINELLK